MSRFPDESVEEWYRRTVIEFRTANAELNAHWERLGLHKRIPPGRLYPLLDRGYDEALERARDIEEEMLEASKMTARHRHA